MSTKQIDRTGNKIGHHFKLSRDLSHALKIAAEYEDRTATRVLERALSSYIEKLKQEDPEFRNRLAA
jgi:predicted transcriptional regulator